MRDTACYNKLFSFINQDIIEGELEELERSKPYQS